MWLWTNDITITRGVTNGTLSMMFTCCPDLMFLASAWQEMHRLPNWSFCWVWAVQSRSSICNKPKLTLFVSFYYFGRVTVILLGVGKKCREQQSKPSPFDKISKTTHRIWHKLFLMIQSPVIINWFPKSFKGSVIYFCNRFFWFLRQNKICMIRIKTQNVLQNWRNIF